MKPPFYILSATLLLVSSCIKVDSVKMCTYKIQAPELATYTYTKTTGQVLQITAIADTLYKDIIWTSPTGTEYKGVKLNVPLASTQQSGNWALYLRSRVDSCVSDKTNFVVTVTQGPPPCSLSGNYFKLGGFANANVSSSSCASFSNYYLAHFLSPTTEPYTTFMDIYFHEQPVNGGFYTIKNTTNVNDILSDECAVQTRFPGTSTCYGQTGFVYTSYVLGQLRIVFCNATFVYASYTYPNTEAALFCN